jgi:polar amino acid transport system substrate-binding protein
MTTGYRVYLYFSILLMVAGASHGFAQDTKQQFPKFRHVDVGAVAPTEAVTGEVKLLADVDFAPFSFKNAGGAMAGVSIEIAQASCAEMRLKCTITALPFAELLPALARGEGDAIITGVRTNAAVLQHASMTRPYFFSFGRFIIRIGTPFESPDVRSLAGRRVGFIKGSSHQAFLEKYYDRSALTPFETEASMFEALRAGGLDVAFTDSMRASFWMKGTASRACCAPLGAGFIDRSTFSRGLTFLVRQDRQSLREAFDFALDKLEDKQLTSKIFAHYFPDSPF